MCGGVCLFLGLSVLDLNLTFYPYIAPRLGTTGATPLLPLFLNGVDRKNLFLILGFKKLHGTHVGSFLYQTSELTCTCVINYVFLEWG